jgi:AraC-like DNA-binding protein/mannose-6-phosphate isomerase-like protein (cupin superfamily)
VKKGSDIAVEFPGLFLVHHNLPDKSVAAHSHDEHILFIPLQGEITVRIRDRALKAGPGRMIYLPPKTEHAFDSSGMQGERLIALVSDRYWAKAEASEQVASVIAVSQLCKELLFHLLLNPKTKHAASLIQTLIHALSESLQASCHLLELDHLNSKSSDPRIQKVIEYFEANLSETISMEKAAKAAGLSVRNLNRLFATELSLTPKQVLNQYRVAKARALLLSGSSVTDAALEIGYSSLSQFIQVFRSLTGQLPSAVARLGQKQ